MKNIIIMLLTVATLSAQTWNPQSNCGDDYGNPSSFCCQGFTRFTPVECDPNLINMIEATVTQGAISRAVITLWNYSTQYEKISIPQTCIKRYTSNLYDCTINDWHPSNVWYKTNSCPPLEYLNFNIPCRII
jgi:hypothetical protein